MPELPERSQSDGYVGTAADRRRLGRQRIGNPHLIAVLRNPGSASPIPADKTADRIAAAAHAEDDDPLAFARGVAFGTLIGTAIWAMIGVALWRLL